MFIRLKTKRIAEKSAHLYESEDFSSISWVFLNAQQIMQEIKMMKTDLKFDCKNVGSSASVSRDTANIKVNVSFILVSDTESNRTLVNTMHTAVRGYAMREGSFIRRRVARLTIATRIPLTTPQSMKFHPAPCQMPEMKRQA